MSLKVGDIVRVPFRVCSMGRNCGARYYEKMVVFDSELPGGKIALVPVKFRQAVSDLLSPGRSEMLSAAVFRRCDELQKIQEV